ncbi:hypothetical protein H2248_007746 [Termitomyces sp. 'cryptogamus']|nr:hypothetical protein H2248_007746 [Termitomyces sp. 'cryptogamus']
MVFVTTSGFSTGPAIMIEVHLWPEALPSMTFFRLQGHVTRPPKTSSSRWSTLQSPVIPPTCSPPPGGGVVSRSANDESNIRQHKQVEEYRRKWAKGDSELVKSTTCRLPFLTQVRSSSIEPSTLCRLVRVGGLRGIYGRLESECTFVPPRISSLKSRSQQLYRSGPRVSIKIHTYAWSLFHAKSSKSGLDVLFADVILRRSTSSYVQILY